jgi:PKD repeat protein
MRYLLRTALAAAVSCALFPSALHADGPGLPNLTYSQSELFHSLSVIRISGGTRVRGQGSVAMHNGYLVVIYAPDSGRTGGGFSFYDISNPRSPRQVLKRDVTAIREPHGFGFSNSYPGDYVVLQAERGIQFWDWSDAANPVLLNYMTLPGVSESDYSTGAWWCFWQAPYVYVGGSGNGIYVVDARNPRSPVLLRQVPRSQTGNFRVGPVLAVGNLLWISSMDQSGYAALDISDPANPVVLRTVTSGVPDVYSAMVNGNRFFGAGTDGRLYIYDVTDARQIRLLRASAGMGGKSGYLTVQDGFAHVGASANYAKVNIATGAVANRGSSGISGRDEDFATVLGNLVMVGNDHGEGSAIMPHQTAPDRTGPSVNMVVPRDGALNQARSSRIGITLTDLVEVASLSSQTFIVRPVGGAALPGKYSTQTGIANFTPDAPLAANTTYEVVVPAGGIKDFAGNGVPAAFVSRFSTGGTIGNPVTCTINPTTPEVVGDSAAFSAQATGSGTLRYSWNFGDGSPVTLPSTSASASHAYGAPAHYAVQLTVSNGTASGNCSVTQTVHRPLPSRPPTRSSTIVFDEDRARIWAVNQDADTVTAIDADTLTKLFERPVGDAPRTLAQAPDGTLWVANEGSANLSVLDPGTGNLVRTIPLPRASRPYGVAFSPDGSAAYVTLQGTGQLLKLSPAGSVVGSLTVRPKVRGIAVSADSSRVLVTRFVSPADHGEVAEVDAASFTLTRVFSLAQDAGPDTESSGRGVPNYITSVTISPDGARAWVPSKKDNTLRGTFRDGRALTFDSTVRTIVSQIDLGTNAELLTARKDLNDRDLAVAVAFSRIGDYAFVATQGTNLVEVVDAYNGSIVTGLDRVGRSPQGLTVTPSGRLFIQNFLSRSVSAYDVRGILSSTGSTFQRLAEIVTVASEPLSAQVLQGKRIFYNADDARMNRDKYISCATCHLDNGQDGRVWDFTDRGEGLRNTVELSGRRGVGHGRVHWTANFDEIQDFEHDIRGSFAGQGFMTNTQFNTGTRNQPLGDPKAGVSADLDALAAFVASLDRSKASPFRNPDGSLTADGQAGKALFQQLRCDTCHSGSDFTDSASGVLHDVGTIRPSSGRRLGQPLTGLDTPTLKGLWDTGPYLHDGSATTLLAVLTTANTQDRHGATSGLTDLQRQQLVAYMLQIDDAEGPPPPEPVRLFLEAESGVLTAPMQNLADAAASGGRYVTVAAGNNSKTAPPSNGHAALSFSVPTAGNYRVWGRVIAANDGDDSFWVRMDGGPWINWNEIALGTSWHWVRVHDSGAGNAVVTFPLSVGAHTLTFAYREDGTRLDRVLVTNDPAFVP